MHFCSLFSQQWVCGFMHSTIMINNIVNFLNSDASDKLSVLENWRSAGTHPRRVFPKLIDILTYYFERQSQSNSITNFQNDKIYAQLITDLQFALDLVRIEDLHYICAQSIGANKNKFYLANILKSILQADLSHCHNQLMMLGKFLALYDPSYIVHAPMMKNVYDEDNIGPAFTYTYFKEKCLPLLLRYAQPDVEQALNQFSVKLEEIGELTPAFIERELKPIFELRWNIIKGTELDYTRQPPVSKHRNENRPWIFIAQVLSGANLISSGYYQFLMPSIKNATVFATEEPIENFPLFHYILSEHGDQLLSLDSSLDYFDKNTENAQFCNRDVCPPRPFTPIEMTRIRYSADRFSKQLELVKKYLQPPVRRSTVNIVYDLIMTTLKKTIDDTDLELAYLVFCEKIGALEPEEREHFYSQRVIWNGDDYSIFEILRKIELGNVKEGCASHWGAYLLKFVLDYRPEVDLIMDIEKWCRVKAMRQSSERKSFRESEQDIIRRNELLMASLLTFSFSKSLFASSKQCSLWGCSNYCNAVLEPFFHRLKLKLETKSKIDAYSELVTDFYIPLLVAEDSKVVSEEVISWLAHLKETLFTTQLDAYYDAKVLFVVLSSFQANTTVKGFLDELVNHFVRIENDSVLNVCANVLFHDFLSKLSDDFRLKLMNALNIRKDNVHNQELVRTLYHYLVDQQDTSWSNFNFFKQPILPRRAHQTNLTSLTTVRDVLAAIRDGQMSIDVDGTRSSQTLRTCTSNHSIS